MTTISIDFYSDPISPWCFIGKRYMEIALEHRPLVNALITWRPYQLNPLMPPLGMEREEYLTQKFINQENAERLAENIRSIGKRVEISFKFERINRTPNTIAAHRLIRYAESFGIQDKLMDYLFHAYFLHGKDIGKIEVLSFLAAKAGLNQEVVLKFLKSKEELDAVKLGDMQARQMGVNGIPFIILDKKFVISGAQEPEAFYPLFDLLLTQKKQLKNGVDIRSD